jgi:hypothetical protein
MFTHKATFAAVVAAFYMFLGGSAQAAIGSHNWQVVAPAGAGFSVLMPGQPKINETRGKSPSGADWLDHSLVWVSPDESESYQAEVCEYTGNLDVPVSIAGVRKGAIGEGKLLWEKNETMNGHPGKKVAATDGKSVWVVEFYVATTRIYVAKYSTRNLLRALSGAMPFLDSFQITR